MPLQKTSEPLEASMDIPTTQILSIALRAGSLFGRFLLVLFLARWLPPSDLGIYGMITASMAFALLLLGMEFYSFSMREIMKANAQEQLWMLRDSTALFSLGYALLVGAATLLLTFGNAPSGFVLSLTALTIFEHLSHEFTRALVALSRPVAANLVLFFRVGAWIYALLLFRAITHCPVTLDTVLWSWLAGAMMSLVVAAYALRTVTPRISTRRSTNWAWIRRGLWAARPFLVTASCALGLSFFDRFILHSYLGSTAVGILTLFSGIATSTQTLVQAGVTNVRLPQLVTAWDSGDRRLFRSISKAHLSDILIWTLPLTLACALAIYPLLSWLGRIEYRHEIDSYHVILLAGAIRCLADAPIFALYAQHRDRDLLGVNAAAFTISVVSNLCLIPMFGLFGCALSALTGSLTLAGAAWVRLGRS